MFGKMAYGMTLFGSGLYLWVDDVHFHQFRFVVAFPLESQYGQQNTLVALGPELWCIHFTFAVDDICPKCVWRCMDGSLRQVYVHRCCHNRSVIHLDMVASTDSRREENNLNNSSSWSNIYQWSFVTYLVILSLLFGILGKYCYLCSRNHVI